MKECPLLGGFQSGCRQASPDGLRGTGVNPRYRSAPHESRQQFRAAAHAEMAVEAFHIRVHGVAAASHAVGDCFSLSPSSNRSSVACMRGGRPWPALLAAADSSTAHQPRDRGLQLPLPRFRVRVAPAQRADPVHQRPSSRAQPVVRCASCPAPFSRHRFLLTR